MVGLLFFSESKYILSSRIFHLMWSPSFSLFSDAFRQNSLSSSGDFNWNSSIACLNVSELYAFSLFFATSTLHSVIPLPQGLLNPLQKHITHLYRTRIPQTKHHPIIPILNIRVEVNHILYVLVVQFVCGEALELGVEVFDVVEGEEVEQHYGLQLEVVAGGVKGLEVLVEEL